MLPWNFTGTARGQSTPQSPNQIGGGLLCNGCESDMLNRRVVGAVDCDAGLIEWN